MTWQQHTTYHKFLRVSAAVCTVALLFESGLAHNATKQISLQTHQYLANAVGVGAAVQPNGINEITAALTEQKQALDVREAALREREIAVNLTTTDELNINNTATYVLSSILFILLVLILLNYVLDYLRYRDRRAQPV